MEETIRYILLFIGTIIILGILWHGLRQKKKRELLMQQKHNLLELKDDYDRIFREEILEKVTEKEPNINEQELNNLAQQHDLSTTCKLDLPNEVAPETDLLEVDDNSLENKAPSVNDEQNVSSIVKDLDLEKTACCDSSSDKAKLKADIISIMVMVIGQEKFGGYDLLQAISANNLHYGDMQIFHYYNEEEVPAKKILFSLASVNEPGDFDLTQIGGFVCDGLILFMDASVHRNPLKGFEKMLEVANQLADDLGGVLRYGKTQQWTDEITQKIKQRLKSDIS